MKFNDASSETGLVQDTLFLCGFGINDTSTYTIGNITRNINAHYRRVNSLIWQATGEWEYDDSNRTNLPIATTDLVDGQQDYTLPSTAQKIDRIEALDKDGNYQLLSPIDKSQYGIAMTELYETTGMPVKYDLIGMSVFIYPKPNTADITLSDGLKVYFSRGVVEFSSSATTREPGFVNDFHRILSLGAAEDFLTGFSPDDVNRINNIKYQRVDLEKNLVKFYGSRHRDWGVKIIPHEESYL